MLYRTPEWLESSSLRGEWPKISLVAIVRNHAQYLECCLESVLSQGYPNLEFVVVDAGGTDGSTEILERFSPYLEIRRHQSPFEFPKLLAETANATKGEIMGWLDPFDMFFPKGLFVVGNVFRELSHVQWLTGRRFGFDDTGATIHFHHPEQRWSRKILLDPEYLQAGLFLITEGQFWRRSLWQKAGACFNLDLRHTFDFERCLRFTRHAQLFTVMSETVGRRAPCPANRWTNYETPYFIELLELIQKESSLLCESPNISAEAPPLILSPLHKPNYFVPPGTRSSPLPLPSKRPMIKDQVRISIVTPVLNQAYYLEECIDSVLSQGWTNLEFVIMDGGSTDGSQKVIEKYKSFLSFTRSAPDAGQYDAINQGFKHTSGEIMRWLNADDKLHPDTFKVVAETFRQHQFCEWLTGRPNGFNAAGEQDWIFYRLPVYSREKFLRKKFSEPFVQQESVFWKRSLWNRSGGYIDTTRSLAADLELWTRFFRYAPLYVVDALLGGFRKLPDQRSEGNISKYFAEANIILDLERELFAQGKFPDMVRAPDPIFPTTHLQVPELSISDLL